MLEIRTFILNGPNENDSNQITPFEGHTDKVKKTTSQLLLWQIGPEHLSSMKKSFFLFTVINENWILICKIHSSLFTKFVASAMTIMSQEYSSAYLNFILHVPWHRTTPKAFCSKVKKRQQLPKSNNTDD